MAEEELIPSDDFVVYGTAVEQLAEDETTSSKPVPVHEQIVTDEKGRQRFHGAFTGGFSAGYFNTVGSIEGWTPRTFQSSRQKKGEASQQRPEDYMDTEDFAAHGIAPKRVVTTDSFGSRSGIRNQDASGGADFPLKTLLAPLSESYGVVLLKKMGWRSGQGIGPRISFREKYARLVKDEKILPLSKQALENEERLSAGKLFAPEDSKPIKMDPKTNYHGIGYKGLDVPTDLLKASTQRFSLFDAPEMSPSLAVPTAAAKQKKNRGMTGQAFGVGAFERDDDDIYTVDDMTRYDRILGDAEKHAMRKEPLKSIEAPGAVNTIEGFQRSTIPLHQAKIYPAPVLPRGFTGQHDEQPLSTPPGALAKPTLPDRAHSHHHAPHDAGTRSALLSDQPAAPPVVKSVFDLIPVGQKNRIPQFQPVKSSTEPSATASRTAVNFVGSVVETPPVAVLPAPSVASVEEMRRNHLALFAGASVTAESKVTFQPFAKDPEKQLRYDMFLKRRHIKGTVALDEIWMDVGASMTEWEREREKGEFFRAAALYRPMTGVMASRFTRETDPAETSSTVEVSIDSGDVTKERKAAAEKKIYGKLTRDTYEWHPDRLVSKRFNVPNPYPTSNLVGILKVKKDKFSLFNFLNVPEGHVPDPETVGETLKATEESKSAPASTSVVTVPLKAQPPVSVPSTAVPSAEPKKFSLPDKPLRTAAPPPPEPEIPAERPSLDIFRAIFDSSDVENDPADDSSDEPALTAPPSEPEKDLFESLLDTSKKARALENKVFSAQKEGAAPAGPVVGPARPPAELLATFAALGNSFKVNRRDSAGSSDDERKRKKRKREKSKKSSKHKKSKKRRKREKSEESSADETDSERDTKAQQKPKSIPVSTRVKVAATESSPDVDPEDISLKLRKLLPGKRLTAADFM